MADTIWRPRGDPVAPLKAHDNGDGTFSLATYGGGGGGGQAVLQDVTLGAAAGFADLAVPAGTYARLEVRVLVRGDTAQDLLIGFQFNGDTGNNYRRASWGFNSNIGAGAGGTNATNAGWVERLTRPDAVANAAAAVIVSILFPQGPWQKVGLAQDTYQDPTFNDQSTLDGFLWLNTAAITTVRVLPQSGNWLANSRFQLLGD